MINTIIKDLTARVETLESEMKSIKWIASECLKMVESNEVVMQNFIGQLNELRSFVRPSSARLEQGIGFRPVKKTRVRVKVDKSAS